MDLKKRRNTTHPLRHHSSIDRTAYTQAIQEESRMQINKGEKSNFIERFHGVELALRDVTDPVEEQVVTIPQETLGKGGTLTDQSLPFTIKVHHFGVNCDFDID